MLPWVNAVYCVPTIRGPGTVDTVGWNNGIMGCLIEIISIMSTRLTPGARKGQLVNAACNEQPDVWSLLTHNTLLPTASIPSTETTSVQTVIKPLDFVRGGMSSAASTLLRVRDLGPGAMRRCGHFECWSAAHWSLTGAARGDKLMSSLLMEGCWLLYQVTRATCWSSSTGTPGPRAFCHACHNGK